MPFIALQGTEKVTPEEVMDNEVVKCPSCKEPMKPRKSHYRRRNGDKFFVARHFWHYNRNKVSCSGGESLTHQKMKSVALSKLKQQFEYSSSGLEKKIKSRRADVFLKFPKIQRPYGKGIIVEVQHKNKAKNIEQITKEYYDMGYSVCWLDKTDFTKKDVDLENNIKPIWPNAVKRVKETQVLDELNFHRNGKVKGFIFWHWLLDSSQKGGILKEVKIINKINTSFQSNSLVNLDVSDGELEARIGVIDESALHSLKKYSWKTKDGTVRTMIPIEIFDPSTSITWLAGSYEEKDELNFQNFKLYRCRDCGEIKKGKKHHTFCSDCYLGAVETTKPKVRKRYGKEQKKSKGKGSLNRHKLILCSGVGCRKVIDERVARDGLCRDCYKRGKEKKDKSFLNRIQEKQEGSRETYNGGKTWREVLYGKGSI